MLALNMSILRCVVKSISFAFRIIGGFMNQTTPKKKRTTTELLFSQFLGGGNYAILEQLGNYKKASDIYNRTLSALGRKVSYRTTNGSTDKVKINLRGIGATNKI